MNTELTELQKLKLELLKMYDGDLVNAKLAFNFIMEAPSGADYDLDKLKINYNKKLDGKRTFMD